MPLPCVVVVNKMSRSEIIAKMLVIRHGQSMWNIEQRWQGRADIDLSDEGTAQAYAAAEKLGTFDIIVSSHLRRALHTAQIISESLGIGPVETDERLQESDIGPWEGLTVNAIEAQWPGYLAARTKPDGFESDESIAARFTTALTDIAQRCHNGTALVVSHSGVIRTLRHMQGAHNPKLPNLGGCWFDVHSDGRVTAGDLVTLLSNLPGGDTL